MGKHNVNNFRQCSNMVSPGNQRTGDNRPMVLQLTRASERLDQRVLRGHCSLARSLSPSLSSHTNTCSFSMCPFCKLYIVVPSLQERYRETRTLTRGKSVLEKLFLLTNLILALRRAEMQLLVKIRSTAPEDVNYLHLMDVCMSLWFLNVFLFVKNYKRDHVVDYSIYLTGLILCLCIILRTCMWEEYR